VFCEKYTETPRRQSVSKIQEGDNGLPRQLLQFAAGPILANGFALARL
jgi:hypothetical protein